MKKTSIGGTAFLAFCLISLQYASADQVILTFDQAGINDFAAVDQSYGDRVVATPDSNGNQYGINITDGNGLTPNVEVEYNANGAGVALWTTGYGSLENVLFAGDFAAELNLNFTADAGFEVGIHDFQLGYFGMVEDIPGIQIRDGDDNVLWSVGQTSIGNTESFSTGGIFASSLTLTIDLTGFGAGSDNFGIDNVAFSQRVSTVPEPTGGIVLAATACAGLLYRRKRTA